jgi:hypothetical protein
VKPNDVKNLPVTKDFALDPRCDEESDRLEEAICRHDVARIESARAYRENTGMWRRLGRNQESILEAPALYTPLFGINWSNANAISLSGNGSLPGTG